MISRGRRLLDPLRTTYTVSCRGLNVTIPVSRDTFSRSVYFRNYQYFHKIASLPLRPRPPQPEKNSKPAKFTMTSNGTKPQSTPPPPGICENHKPIPLHPSTLNLHKTDTPVPTFFASESSSNYNPTSPPLDLETQTKHSLFQARGGIRGLVILGSTGEAIFIKRAERIELIRSQRKALDEAGFGDRVIIAGTGGYYSGSMREQLVMFEQRRRISMRRSR